MSTNIDLKDLWNSEATSIPDVKEIFSKGAELQSRTRNKLIFNTIIPLTLIVAFASVIWLYRLPQMVTTNVGVLLVVGAIAFFIIAARRYLNLLNKVNTDSNITGFLQHFLHLKQKQENLSTTILNIYFSLLTAGLALCAIEYLKRFSFTSQILAYGIGLAWIGFNWFYLIPKVVKKQRDKTNVIIKKLELFNKQMGAEE